MRSRSRRTAGVGSGGRLRIRASRSDPEKPGRAGSDWGDPDDGDSGDGDPGEVAVGAFTTAVDMVNLQEQGAPIDFLIPDPAWTAQNLVYIVESAGHPNAAQLFVDFFASPEGQRAAAKYGATPLSAVAPETLGGNSRIVLTNLDRILEPGWAEDFAARWRQIYE